jgi:hypothetical protein
MTTAGSAERKRRSRHVCRACDEVITGPDDAVIVMHEQGNSGPGWDVWATVITPTVELIDPDLLRIMTRIWATKIQQ